MAAQHRAARQQAQRGSRHSAAAGTASTAHGSLLCPPVSIFSHSIPWCPSACRRTAGARPPAGRGRSRPESSSAGPRPPAAVGETARHRGCLAHTEQHAGTQASCSGRWGSTGAHRQPTCGPCSVPSSNGSPSTRFCARSALLLQPLDGSRGRGGRGGVSTHEPAAGPRCRRLALANHQPPLPLKLTRRTHHRCSRERRFETRQHNTARR